MPLRMLALALALATVALAGCSSSSDESPARAPAAGVLTLGAIPDQDPQELARLYPVVARNLSRRLGVRVVYRPVTDYAAAVTAFRTGDLDLVWFGGLTGVQALHQVPGARALAQRDIDAHLRSVFIASRRSGLGRVSRPRGLAALRGRRFTFGSESSTSGRLMPEFFLRRAGVSGDDFRGGPGFSGSHDKTIALVASGSYDAGALNEQIWRARVEEGEVDRDAVRVIYRTPAYHDYMWVARPGLDGRLGEGFTERLRGALLGMRDRRALDLFGARRFIPVGRDDHRQVRAIARELDLLGAAGA